MKTFLPLKRDKLTRPQWGYTVDPNDPYLLLPVIEHLQALEEGKDMLDKGASLRKVAAYITAKTGVVISQTSVRNFYYADPLRKLAAEKRDDLLENYKQNNINRKGRRLPEELKLKRAIGRTKGKLTRKEKKLQALKEEQRQIADKLSQAFVKQEAEPKLTVVAEPAVNQIQITPNPGPQTEFLAAPEFEVLYGGAAGGGKAQPLDALVHTPEGFRFMGNIKVGSVVSTPSGSCATVTQIHPQGVTDIYTVTFQDGSKVECTKDHLWYCKPVRDGQDRWAVRTTEYMLKSKRTFVVPLTQPVEMPENSLPIHPYAMGCLLGDGGMSSKSVSYTSADSFIIDKLAKHVDIVKHPAKYAYGIRGINSVLRNLGLMGKNSHNKFIPDCYLLGSKAQRIELLQGLMDTDGYISADGKVNFTSMSKALRDGVAWLVRSLGGTAKEFKGHSLYIRHPDSQILFSLPRKLARVRKKVINNRIVSIELSGQKAAQCITLDSQDQLYITDNFVVTHNSWALLVDPLRTVHLPAHKAIIFRKTNDDLRTLIAMSKEFYPKLIPGAKFNEQKSTWYFPGGGWMWFRYLDKDADVESMQGQDFSWAGFDELTQWSTPFVYEYIRSRVRTTDPEIQKYCCIRASANPGGVGGHWVKKTFIDPSPPNTAFIATNLETGQPMYWPDNHDDPEKRGKPLFYRRFIPARLKDNPYLYKTGSYEAGLMSLPEVQRRQLLEGDWDVAEGAAFTEFNRHIHTCAPFDIPSHWMRFRAADWGYTQPGCVLWFACDPNGNLYVYREFYHSRTLTPKFCQAPDVADKILELEMGENVRYGVLDSSTWNQRGSGDTGPSIAETMIKRGCMWRPSDRHKFSRKFGKMEIHRRLQVRLLPDEISGKITEKPQLVIFNTCVNLIRTLPTIPMDKNDPEDVDTDSEDHAYDALRYGCASRPINPNMRVYRPHISAAPQTAQYNAFGFPV